MAIYSKGKKVGVTRGVVPTGNINLTNTNSTNVKLYETAQVVDANLTAGNIKKDVSILGVTGTYEGSGGGIVSPSYVSFCNYDGTSLDISWLRTNNITNMHNMFSSCSSLTSLDLSNFNTSEVTSMNDMFNNCNRLTTLNLSNFNTSNVTNMARMFNNCIYLTSLDLSSFNTSNVTSMYDMFAGCRSLTSLDLSNFNTSNVTNMARMFNSCSSLTILDISNFDFTNVTNYSNMFTNVPTNCLIYVKDQTAKDWIESKFTTLTNVQIKVV